jgi:hypothetical protein
VAFRRDIEPITRLGGVEEERRAARSGRLATGTLACPRCDAPVALAAPTAPATRLACPFCNHAGALRDFLSLGEPTRPARVRVSVVHRART